MFSVDEMGANAGDIRILAAADREMVDSYIISIRVGRCNHYGPFLHLCQHENRASTFV